MHRRHKSIALSNGSLHDQRSYGICIKGKAAGSVGVQRQTLIKQKILCSLAKRCTPKTNSNICKCTVAGICKCRIEILLPVNCIVITAVSVTASLVQNNELAVSNVVGSNIFNLMLVIGVCSILTPIMVQKATVVRDIPLSLGCALLLLVLGISGLGDKAGMTLGHADGIIFLIVFAGYIFTMVRSAMKARAAGQKVEIEGVEECDNMKELSYGKSILFLIVGAAAIAFGGDLTVDTASRIAIELGMSQTLVGLTIVSIGTSLPELVTSVVAARKNEVDMAVGNAVGSNIFNILMVLGISSAISPVALIRENLIDIVLLMVFSVMVWIFAGTRKKIERKEGIIMVVVYLVYCAYIIAR